MKRLLILSVALLAAGCSPAETERQEVVVVDDAPVAATPVDTVSISVDDAYIVAPLKGRDVTAGYFIIQNNGSDVRLVSASSPIAAEVEIHTHSMSDGVMQMREVDGVDLSAGESVTFEPGGLHLMMFGFSRTEGQTETPVTLEFEGGESVMLTLPIRERE